MRPRLPRVKWILGFLLYFAYLAFWCTLHPPGSGPDEGSHLNRCLSLSDHPFTLDSTNPLIPSDRATPFDGNPLLVDSIFQLDRKLSSGDLVILRQLDWNPPGDHVPAFTYHHHHPTLYYWAVHGPAHALTQLCRLSPWDSFLTYRWITALYAAILWMLTLHLAGRALPFRGTPLLLASLMLNPMVIYLSSSVNSDAFTLPIATWTLLSLIIFLRRSHRPAAFLGGLLTLASIKASFLPMAASLFFGLAIAAYLEKARKRRALLRASMLTGAVGAGSWAAYYSWNPPYFMGTPAHDSLIEYIVQIPLSLKWMFIHYWGSLGWQDCTMPEWSYKVIALGTACLGFYGARTLLRPTRWIVRTLLICLVIFTIVLFVGEFSRLSVSGHMLSGRYWLPMGLIINMVFLSRHPWVRVATLVMMLTLNLYFVWAIQLRYYT